MAVDEHHEDRLPAIRPEVKCEFVVEKRSFDRGRADGVVARPIVRSLSTIHHASLWDMDSSQS